MATAEKIMSGKGSCMEQKPEGAGSLPEKLRPYFWDTDFDALDTRKNKLFIISRLYTKGGKPGVKWVDENYTDDDIMEAARKRKDFRPNCRKLPEKKIRARERGDGVLQPP